MGRPYYEQDGITIYHGDCLDVLREIDRFDLLITDPPYSSGARRDADKQVRTSMLRSMDDDDWFSHDQLTAWGWSWFFRPVLLSAVQSMLKGSHLYIFSDWRQTPNVYGLSESVGLRVNHCLVWDKGIFGMGAYWRNQHENIIFASIGQPNEMRNHGCGSVLQFPPVHSSARQHPTEKPIGLLRSLIDAVPGNLICDPFMGSGTTLRAAKDLGRKAIGIEIEERYCEIAAHRLSQEVLALA